MASRLHIVQFAMLLVLLYAMSYAFAASCRLSVIAYEHTNCTGLSKGYPAGDFVEGRCTASADGRGSFIANCTSQSVEVWLSSLNCSTGTQLELVNGVCTPSDDDAFLAVFWNSAALYSNWLSVVMSLF